MKLFLHCFTIVLLLFNSTGAFYGGYHLIMHPDGSSMHLPLYLLKSTPFTNYYIPGIILIICNGCFGVLVLLSLFLKRGHRYWFIIAQGIILSIWIIMQVLLIKTFSWLQLVLGITGIALMVLGTLLNRFTTSKNNFSPPGLFDL